MTNAGAKLPASRLVWCPLSESSRGRFGGRHGAVVPKRLSVAHVCFGALRARNRTDGYRPDRATRRTSGIPSGVAAQSGSAAAGEPTDHLRIGHACNPRPMGRRLRAAAITPRELCRGGRNKYARSALAPLSLMTSGMTSGEALNLDVVGLQIGAKGLHSSTREGKP